MQPLTPENLRHYYFNKYLVSPFKKDKYHISYCYDYKALWFRTYKVASRTINYCFKEESQYKGYFYSSEVSYIPSLYSSFFKFAFISNPVDRFISIWKGMVLKRNYFEFSEDEYSKMKNFESFLTWVENQDIESADVHLLPQNKLIDLNNIDYLGRFKNFSNDFLEIANEIDLSISEEDLIHKNKSPKIDFTLNSEDKKRIIKIYHKDVKLFYPRLDN